MLYPRSIIYRQFISRKDMGLYTILNLDMYYMLQEFHHLNACVQSRRHIDFDISICSTGPKILGLSLYRVMIKQERASLMKAERF
jgi:hypothetical protein